MPERTAADGTSKERTPITDWLRSLKTLAGSFHHLHENANGVTDAEFGQIGAELSLLDGTNDFTHFMGLLPS